MYPSNTKIDEYIKIMGDRGRKTIKMLGQKQDFITAFNSKLGNELLEELIEMHELMFKKIATLDATPTDKIKFQVVGQLLASWATKVADYERKCKGIINVVNKAYSERKV